ncbi:hypothetical protein ZOSMA_45G00470 [Zostera marina]|uniref:Uncharacterized protein n=1 Tax=Zostera marina TaxID=29655 RepID=A0A0K9P0B8_ZOSMR|nr:hypothetical protein ZOSMA_45G00470 [Zostera marina]
MEIVKKKRHVDEDAAKISMVLNDHVVGEVDKKNEEYMEEKVTNNEGIQVSDNAGEGTSNKLDVSGDMEKKDEEVLDVAKNSIDITDITKPVDITANELQEPIIEDNEEAIIKNQETFVFPTFNLNISQDQPTPRLNDDGDDVVILKSIPTQTEKASIEVKKELYEAWELGRGLVGQCTSSLEELNVVVEKKKELNEGAAAKVRKEKEVKGTRRQED